MRLLTIRDDETLALTKDIVDAIPPYAILSHTWGSDEDEVTFRDVTEGTGCDKLGYQKIRLCGKQAVSDGMKHFWVDTCCIDKSNNAELSEALNSMFRWYQNAQKCYVYLSDVTCSGQEEHEELPQSAWSLAFRQSRWFTRGWTLQELIAPSVVEFFSTQWQPLGDKEALGLQIHDVTGIPIRVLQGCPLSDFTVDERISWSGRRTTKRAEDMAYCLMGIFNVFLPPIYGEGRDHAILRLNQQIDDLQRHSRNQIVPNQPLDLISSPDLAENSADLTETASKVLGQKLDSIENLLRSQLGQLATQNELPIGIHHSFDSQTHDLSVVRSTRQDHALSSTSHITTYENLPKSICQDSTASKENDFRYRSQALQKPSPASALELGRSFKPELYTTNHALPRLFCYAVQQEQRLDYSVVQRYEMIYLSAPRECKRITVSITMNVETPYWTAMNAPVNDCWKLRGRSIDIPVRLLSTIEKALISVSPLRQDTHLSLYLGGQSVSYNTNSQGDLNPKIEEPIHSEAYLGMTTSMLYHMDIPWYLERDIDSRPLITSRPSLQFVSFLKPRWVLDFRIGSLPEYINSATYQLQLLQTLRNAPGVNPLAGVILDSETKALRGYLSELPAQRQALEFLNQVYESGGSIAWNRREKWCRQLVQAVAEVHTKGFVVGILSDFVKDGIGLDWSDNVVLYRFQTEFIYGDRMIDLPPPEYRYSASGEGSLPAIFQTDIYQLGFLLWRIALPAVGAQMDAFITRTGQAENASEENTNYTHYTADLPMGDHIPQYLQDIITACRAESPDQRPPARKLLGMFPLQKDNSSESAAPSQHKQPDKAEKLTSTQLQGYPTRLEQIYGCWKYFCRCNRCGGETVERRFHCNVCSSGDFDLCPECMADGRHCLDDKHYLFELPGSEKGDVDVFYSSPDMEGHRNTITI